MKVAEVMRRSVVSVTPSDSVRDVARLIFSLGINGIPVIEDEKLVGIITEEDIFKKVNSSVSKSPRDSSKNFESTEQDITNTLDSSVKKVMNENVTTVSPEDSITHAQIIMHLNHYSRLPVVNSKGEFIGTISERDVFNEIMKNVGPKIETERYVAFKSIDFEEQIDWDKRIKNEFPEIFSEFKKHNVENIMDIGCWTGQYSIELAQRGVKSVLGIDHSPTMIEASKGKLKRLEPATAKKVEFLLSDFSDIEEAVEKTYDAAICMGNALSYIPVPAGQLFQSLSKKMTKKGAIIIIQLRNIDKAIKNGGLHSFRIQRARASSEKENMFIEFYDKYEENRKLLQQMVTFSNEDHNWAFKGLASIQVFHYTKEAIEKALKSAGFGKITFSGCMGDFPNIGKMSFSAPFDSIESDWMNILAEKI